MEVTCPKCGKKLRAPQGLAGKHAKCPECGQVLLRHHQAPSRFLHAPFPATRGYGCADCQQCPVS